MGSASQPMRLTGTRHYVARHLDAACDRRDAPARALRARARGHRAPRRRRRRVDATGPLESDPRAVERTHRAAWHRARASGRADAAARARGRDRARGPRRAPGSGKTGPVGASQQRRRARPRTPRPLGPETAKPNGRSSRHAMKTSPVVSDLRGPYGALMESYPGLVLSVGTLRAQTAKALYLAMRIGDEPNARQAVLAGDARGQRSSDPALGREGESDATPEARDGCAGTHPWQDDHHHRRPAGGDAPTRGGAGRRRPCGIAMGNHSRSDFPARWTGHPSGAKPVEITGTLCVDGVAVQRIRRDGSVE